MKARRYAEVAALLPASVLLLVVGQVPESCARLSASLGPYPPRLETLLGDLAVLVAVAASTWLTMLSAVALGCRASRTPLPRIALALAPRSWRPVVAAVAGAAVLVATPASASTGGSGSSGSSSASGAAVQPPTALLQGLPLPDRPGRLPHRIPHDEHARRAPSLDRPPTAEPADATGPRAARRVSALPPPDRPVHRVVRGESLWSIASAALRATGNAASRQHINRSWRRWYATNRAVIGDDPDTLRVGLVLRRPGPAPARWVSSPTPPDEGESR